MIEAARTALAAGDARAALEALLEAWRERPARLLAEAIDAVGQMAAYGMHAPSGAMPIYRDENWLAEAKRGDVVMRQRLVETITDTNRVAEKLERAKALLAMGHDPRTAMALVALAASRGMPWHADFSKVWNPLFEMIGNAGDPRVREALARAPWTEIVIGTPRQKEAFRQRIAKYDAKLAKVFAARMPELAPDEERIVEEMIAIARAPSATEEAENETEAALLAAVHATPGDLGVRAIYGDYLQERGDPRGELIALQLAHEPGTRLPPEIHNRLQQLFGQHAVKWLGEMAVHIAHEIYRQGFLDSIKFKKAAYDGPYAVPPPDPLWSTVRTVCGGVPASDELPMPILERALEIDHRGMRVLARLAKAPPLREIEWRGTDPAHDGDAVADFATIVKRSPALRTFTIRGTGETLAWTWRETSIRALVVEAPSKRLAHWLAQSAGLDEIVVRHDRWRTTLGAAGELVARQDSSGNLAEVLPHLEAALDRVGDRLVQVEITVSAKQEWRLPERQRMAAILARHPRWSQATKIYGYREPG